MLAVVLSFFLLPFYNPLPSRAPLPVAYPVAHQFADAGSKQTGVALRGQTHAGVGPANVYYQHSELTKALRKTAALQKAAETRLGEFYKKRYCIDNNIVSSYSQEQTPAYVAFFGAKTKELGALTEKLNTLIQTGPDKTNLKQINQYQFELKKLVARLDSGFNEICATERTLCGCYSG